jgi:Beta-lactamase
MGAAQGPSANSVAPLDSHRIQSIDSFVANEMTRQRIPGLAVGIYSRGRLLLAKGYGQANVELGVPVKAETIFQSGSVGKQFVSAAIMMLVEEGKLLRSRLWNNLSSSSPHAVSRADSSDRRDSVLIEIDVARYRTNLMIAKLYLRGRLPWFATTFCCYLASGARLPGPRAGFSFAAKRQSFTLSRSLVPDHVHILGHTARIVPRELLQSFAGESLHLLQ